MKNKPIMFMAMGLLTCTVALFGGFYYKNDGTIMYQIISLRYDMIGMAGIFMICIGHYLSPKD